MGIISSSSAPHAYIRARVHLTGGVQNLVQKQATPRVHRRTRIQSTSVHLQPIFSAPCPCAWRGNICPTTLTQPPVTTKRMGSTLGNINFECGNKLLWTAKASVASFPRPQCECPRAEQPAPRAAQRLPLLLRELAAMPGFQEGCSRKHCWPTQSYRHTELTRL